MINYRSRGIKKYVFDKYINKIFWEEFFIKLNEEEKMILEIKPYHLEREKFGSQVLFKILNKRFRKIKIGKINYLTNLFMKI